MRPADLLKFALKALRERKLRAVLTIIGIVIGPATIVALVGATQGYSSASTSQFKNLGATTIFVSPAGKGFSLTSDTVQEIRALPDVVNVVPYQEASGTITQGGGSVGVTIISANLSQLNDIFPSLTIGSGSLPQSSDAVGSLVGNTVAYPDITGAENLTVNDVLAVSDIRSSGFRITFTSAGGAASFFGGGGSSSSGTDRSFIVTGVLSPFGSSFLIDPDQSIFVQPIVGQELLNTQAYSGIVVIASSAKTVDTVTSELSSQFGSDISTTAATSLLSTVESVTSGTTTLLEAVAGTSVIVAFVGIMTTMLTSVLERTTEIGVLKSLGASSRSIMMMFISEAAVTGVIGGAVGAGVGAGLSFVVISALSGTLGFGGFGGGARAASTAARGAVSSGFSGASFAGPASASSTTLSITPVITPELIVIAILIAAAVGTIGGLLPAWRASRLTPVEALHRS